MSSLSKGLVAHYRLGKTDFNPSTKRFTNLAPYPHGTGHGTKLGSADPGFVADRMGQLERAAPFGGDDYIDCGNDASLDFSGVNAFSGVMWVNMSDATHFRMIGSIDAVHKGWIFALSGSDKLYFQVGTSTTNRKYWHGNTIRTADENSWHCYAFVFDGSDAIIYRDGIVEASTLYANGAGDFALSGVSTKIGIWTQYANGAMAESYIWDRELESQERTLLNESYLV